MAFLIANWDCLSSSVKSTAISMWTYKSTTDALATIMASAYFNDRINTLAVGHVILVDASDKYEMVRVTSVTGNVTTASYIPSTIETESIVTSGDITCDALTLTNVLTFSDGGTIDNTSATTLTITETNIDLVGATAADALTLSDVLTFSDGGTIDNTAADTLTITETNIDLTGTAILDDVTIAGVVAQTAVARPSSAYAYFYELDCDEFMTGGAATKTYMLGISGERPVGSAATGDSNDAIIKGSYSNYAANDTNFIIRGLNSAVTNRSGGTLGMVDGGNIGSKNQGTCPTLRALSLRAENYGTNATEYGVIDINCSDEVGAATLRYGARIRNTDASGVAAMSSALLISSTATNGFNNAITIQNACDTFVDFDGVTGAACTETGTEATTFAGRIKVVTPDGNDAWINVYSTSNA